MTVVLIICSYADQEFVRVGYYVNNEYEDEEMRLEPPEAPVIEKIVRNILADKPRVTRFPVKWDGVDETEMPPEVVGFEGDDGIDGTDEIEKDDYEMEDVLVDENTPSSTNSITTNVDAIQFQKSTSNNAASGPCDSMIQ